MPDKLIPTIKNIDIKIKNQINKQIIENFMNGFGTKILLRTIYQNGLLKVLIRYGEYLGNTITFYGLQHKEQILGFWILKKNRKR